MSLISDADIVGGRKRARPLAEMLSAAQSSAAQAGITRLANITALDRLGLPIFQAARPNGKCLSTALGKGFTRRAATVSALLEGIEINAAENVQADQSAPLEAFDDGAVRTWFSASRSPLAVRLNPELSRNWVKGFDLVSGQVWPIPFDLVSLDFTVARTPDATRSTVGLASGGNLEEACVSALAEILEYHLEANWRCMSTSARRRTRVDLASIDHPLVRAALSRIRRSGAHVHLWAMGQHRSPAAFFCAITDPSDAVTNLCPTGGTGCHPDRGVAALLAVLEAAQARAAMISGARDDLLAEDYSDARGKTIALVLEMMCVGAAVLQWSDLNSVDRVEPKAALEHLIDAATQETSLPVLAKVLPSPHVAIEIVRVVAPGLQDPHRNCSSALKIPSSQLFPVIDTRSKSQLVFVGPTLWDFELPSSIERRPPAKCGDLASLLDNPPRAIGLIDGCFETGPSVWHKEILDLIAHGTAIYGAASLGALRAADLHALGMVGVGQVFEAYRDGHILRDDAVMLVHAPSELRYQPITIALVEAEAALSMAKLPDDERRMLQRIARTMSFRHRSWQAILSEFRRRTGRPSIICEKALTAMPSVKRTDAIKMIAMMADCAAANGRRERPPLTTYYQALLARR